MQEPPPAMALLATLAVQVLCLVADARADGPAYTYESKASTEATNMWLITWTGCTVGAICSLLLVIAVYYVRRHVRTYSKDRRERKSGHKGFKHRNPRRYWRLSLQLERMPLSIPAESLQTSGDAGQTPLIGAQSQRGRFGNKVGPSDVAPGSTRGQHDDGKDSIVLHEVLCHQVPNESNSITSVTTLVETSGDASC